MCNNEHKKGDLSTGHLIILSEIEKLNCQEKG